MVGMKREASPTKTNPKSPLNSNEKKEAKQQLNSNKLAYSALSQTTTLNSTGNTPIKQHFMQDEEEQEAVDDGEPKVEMVLTPLKSIGKFDEQDV